MKEYKRIFNENKEKLEERRDLLSKTELQKLGYKLLDWYDGMSDPLYKIGSSLIKGILDPFMYSGLIEDALYNLKSDFTNSGLHPKQIKELKLSHALLQASFDQFEMENMENY
mgnify:CR=1 FL=1